MGEQRRMRRKAMPSTPRREQVCRTDIRTAWACVPRGVRLPPQTLRFTTAGRIVCSERQFVAAIPSLTRNVNRSAK